MTAPTPPKPIGNAQVHSTMRAFMWFSPDAQEPQAEPFKSGLPASNDGELNEADLEAIDREYAIAKDSGEVERRRIAYAHRHDDPWRRP